VEARKHDELKSLIDHRMLSSPFSFGARMCMGSRLAELEIMSLLAQLVAKFEFKIAPEGQTWTKTMRTMSIPDRVPTMLHAALGLGAPAYTKTMRTMSTKKHFKGAAAGLGQKLLIVEVLCGYMMAGSQTSRWRVVPFPAQFGTHADSLQVTWGLCKFSVW